VRKVRLFIAFIVLAIGLSGCEVAERFVALRSKVISSSPSSFTLEIVNTPTSASALSALDTGLKVEVYDESGSLVLDPVVIKAEIVDDPTGLAELFGDLEVTTVGGIADFGALGLDLPATGYTLRFYTDDGPELQTDPFDVVKLDVTVAAAFPINGANFMDYLPRVTTKKIHEQEDRSDLFTSINFHGGEIRKVLLPDTATCDGLSVEETLAAFRWACSDEGSQTFFYSLGFKDGKGLRDLLNASSFKSNQVFIKKSGITVAESTLSNTWWTNPVTPLTLNSGVADPVLSLNTSGTIYTVSASAATRGIQMATTKVALVTLGTNTVISNTAASAAIDCQSQFPNAQSICMIAGSFAGGWIEAKINYTLAVRAIYIGTGSSFDSAVNNFRIHNSEITTTHASSYAVYIEAGYFKMTDTYVKASGVAGIFHDYGGLATYDNVHVSGGSFFGVMSGTNAWRHYFNRLTVENSGGRGFDSTGFFKTILNSKIFNNVGAGLEFGIATDNTVQNSIVANNGGAGIDGGPSTESNYFSGNFIANNGGAGIELRGIFTGGRSYIENNVISNNGIGIRFDDSEEWTVSNNLLRNNATAISITNGSTDLIWTNKLILDANTADCSFSAAGASPGLSGAACDNAGTSNATRLTTTDTSAYWTGAVADAANTHATGVSTFAALTDWRRFSSRFRLWVKAAAARGRCSGADTCNIFDFSLSPTGTEARFVNGTPTNGAACPASINGTESFEIYSSYALRNAMEIPNDLIGNDNGFCQSGEACIFKPHIGAYQGDENLPLQSCEFQNGTNLTNIKIYYYPET